MDPPAEMVEPQQPTLADAESVHDEENNDPPPVTVPDAPPPPQQDTVFPPNLQAASGPYISVGTGWPAMARIVHEVDAQKIQDYKEDIDTILVFVRHSIYLPRLELICRSLGWSILCSFDCVHCGVLPKPSTRPNRSDHFLDATSHDTNSFLCSHWLKPKLDSSSSLTTSYLYPICERYPSQCAMVCKFNPQFVQRVVRHLSEAMAPRISRRRLYVAPSAPAHPSLSKSRSCPLVCV
jgi:hypothetical protein